MSDKTKNKKQESKRAEDFINPIDKDKIAENPSTLPYAHSVGGVPIQPNEKGVMKSRSIKAMEEQTDRQMTQLYEQMQTLAEQAKKLQKRTEISRWIYAADAGFQPLINHHYFLYERKEGGDYILSMIAPTEWGRKKPFRYIAEVRLLADHTWEIIHENLPEAEVQTDV
ncbi:MAG: DUF2452 domain-containing protein [Bernardetiaceae bacterium]|nr:DUF2452 domain-containing protein [Bernardetiaceae bacterium]